MLWAVVVNIKIIKPPTFTFRMTTNQPYAILYHSHGVTVGVGEYVRLGVGVGHVSAPLKS